MQSCNGHTRHNCQYASMLQIIPTAVIGPRMLNDLKGTLSAFRSTPGSQTTMVLPLPFHATFSTMQFSRDSFVISRSRSPVLPTWDESSQGATQCVRRLSQPPLAVSCTEILGVGSRADCAGASDLQVDLVLPSCLDDSAILLFRSLAPLQILFATHAAADRSPDFLTRQE